MVSEIWYVSVLYSFYFFFSSRRRHTRFDCDWSSDVCSSDLAQRFLDVRRRQGGILGEEERRDGRRVRCGRRGAEEGAGGRTGGGASGVADADAVEAGEGGLGAGRGRGGEDPRPPPRAVRLDVGPPPIADVDRAHRAHLP